MKAFRSVWQGPLTLLALGLGCAGLAGCDRSSPPPPTAAAAQAPAPPDLFEDVTPASGIDFTYRNGEEADHYSVLESLGGGVALLDYDGDGLLDIFVTGGGFFDKTDAEYKKDPAHPPRIRGLPCKLYRNLGGWKFQDVTAEVGLDHIPFYSHGAAAADYDGDGWPDLLVTGYGGLALFHNEPDGKGGRRFVDVTKKAGLAGPQWATSAAFGDLDGDGYPDLYVCQYLDWSFRNNPACVGQKPSIKRDLCAPPDFRGLPHVLYRNNRDGTFSDVSKEAGLRRGTAVDGKGLGVLLADLNGDGKPDIYVANDTDDNFLYMNRSRPGHIRLEEKGLAAGVARDDRGTANGSMGVDAADYNGTGRPSLWVTNYEMELHALYRNMGHEFFLFSSRAAGVAAVGERYVAFGTGFVDVDGDGWEDLFFVNGHVRRHPAQNPRRQRPVLLRNRGDGTFANITPQGGPYFRADHTARGVAVGDLDNDGSADLVINQTNEPVVVLRGRPPATAAGDRPHWLGVELVGRGHRDVVGTTVRLEAGGRRLVRFAKGGGSYLSSGDRRLLFGLGPDGRGGRVTVTWPSGQEQSWDGLAVDRYWQLVEGEREAREPRPPRGS